MPWVFVWKRYESGLKCCSLVEFESSVICVAHPRLKASSHSEGDSHVLEERIHWFHVPVFQQRGNEVIM